MNSTHAPRPQSLVLTLLLFLGALLSAYPAPGDVDLSFDAGSGLNADVTAIAVQNDGKVIVGGNFSTVRGLSRVGIARLNADGSGDGSFGVAGPSHSYGAVGAIALQPDGKVIFSHQQGLTRLNANGTIDESFDAAEINSIAHYDGPIYGPSAIAIQPDGKVLIGGPGDLRRLNADGSFDSSFTASDRYVEAITLQPDGKVLIGGMEPKIARLNADGSVDSSFQPTEDEIAGIVSSIVLQPDGKVLLAGNVSVLGVNEAVIRLNANGSRDGSFNSGPASGPSKIVLQPDGRIVICGELFNADGTPRKGAARLNANGSDDSTFDRSANADNVVVALALQADGRVLMGGDFTNLGGVRRHRIARCNADGTVDLNFDPGAPVDFFSSVVEQADGKILIGGVFTFIQGAKRFARERLNADGSPDATFVPDFFAPDYGFIGGEMDYNLPKSHLVQADGKVLIGGVHHFYIGNDEGYTHFTRSFLHRVHPAGSRDTSFAAGEMEVRDIAQQADGKILVAGNIVVNGVNYAVARLNLDGSVDGTFNLGTPSAHGSSLVVQGDGKIVVGGFQFLRRLNPDGTVDPAFLTGTDGVTTVALQSDGKLLISHVDNVSSTGRISRLNSNGTADPTFYAELGLYGSVNSITLQQDGMIIMGGDFPTVNGVVRPRIARLFGGGAQPPASPEIAIEQPAGTLLVDGAASVNFGSTAPGNNVDRTFTVRNSGDAQLTGVNATIGGTDASEFSVTTQPSASIAGFNGSTTFTVRFAPGARGSHTATLQLASDDADENPFDIALSGSGANLAPTAGVDTASTAYQTAVEIHVLANDNDPEGDLLSITGASAAAHGTTQAVATSGGQRIRYTPTNGFFGTDTFTYAISDGFGGTATGTVTVTVAAKARGKKTVSKGGAVAGAGEPASGVPAGATWKTFGIPSIAGDGTTAFGATITTAGGIVPIIYRGCSDEEPAADAEQVVASKGDDAPGVSGATFGSFKDPLLNDAGTIVFVATLRSPAGGAKGGIWKHYPGQGNGESALVMQLGSEAAGVPGARWRTVTSVAVSDGAAGDETIAFTAAMVTGPGGVRASSDAGLWLGNTNGTALALREGAMVMIGGTPRKVRSFVALQALPGAAGQGNGVTAAGVLARVKFDDGSHGILRVWLDENGLGISAIALAGEAPAGIGATLATFGLPTQSRAGHACFSATLSPAARENDTAIFRSDGSAAELVAREGDQAVSADAATFSSFHGLAIDIEGRVAFSVSLHGGAATTANNTAIFLQEGHTRDVIARKGDQPPGVPAGAKWESFPSLALPNGGGGLIFIGKLVAPRPGQPNPAGVTRGNETGLWAVDQNGESHLIVRTGDTFDPGRMITALALLPNVPCSPTQARGFSDSGNVIYRVTLNDGSQHVVTLSIP